MTESAPPFVIVGAGLSGLACAVRLHEASREVVVVEASDGVGGRVRTDEVDGFLLDRGFQVYLDAYRTAGESLDLPALELHRFEPGALVWKGEKRQRISDPFRRPKRLWESAISSIGNPLDKIRILALRSKLKRKSLDEIWKAPETTTFDRLCQFGFSERMIDQFFRGFYGGIFLENHLVTSSRIFEFTFKMFSEGYATLPKTGMGAIPSQLASRLPGGAIRLNSPASAVRSDSVTLESGEVLTGIPILATESTAASELCGETSKSRWNSVSCLHFAANEAPFSDAMILLPGDREGLINDLCVPSNVCPHYAPEGKALISVSVLGDHRENGELTRGVETELEDWFGESATNWKHLRTLHIPHALPVDPPGHCSGESAFAGPPYVCGDYMKSGSIEGAILSGQTLADQLLDRPNGE